MPLDGQGQPQQEKLLVGQPPPRAGQLFGVVGGVDLLDRPLERPEVVGLQILVGKDLFQQMAEGGDRLADDLPHLPLLQALGERIDRQDPPLAVLRPRRRANRPWGATSARPGLAASACRRTRRAARS